jgi:phage terminase small subunit
VKFTKNTKPAARQEASRLVREYDITDPGGEALLRTFASAFSLELQCQEQIDREGLTYKDRFEQVKPHPLLPTLRDARSQKLAALKALNLDLEPLESKPGRPPGR